MKEKMKGMAPKEQKLRREVEVAEVQFEEADRVQEEIAELEQLLLERTDALNECKGKIEDLELDGRKLRKQIHYLTDELHEANAILDNVDDKIEQYENIIQSLTEEVRAKQQLEERIVEQEVRADLRRQMVDISVSQASANVSDNSKAACLRGPQRKLESKASNNDAQSTVTRAKAGIEDMISYTDTGLKIQE